MILSRLADDQFHLFGTVVELTSQLSIADLMLASHCLQ